MALVAFAAVDPTSLRWLRRGASPLEFDLLAGDQPVATLIWKSGTGSLATARTASGSWTLKRTGFLNPRVTVRAEGTTTDVAHLSVHWNYHRIEIRGRPPYRFHRAGVLVPAWQVTQEGGAEVLHVEPVREGRKLVGGAVIAAADAKALGELPLLLVVSWHFI
ncbi:MAG: hypothetical protein ACREEC_04005, partial [Thermoplasmata archaeon]